MMAAYRESGKTQKEFTRQAALSLRRGRCGYAALVGETKTGKLIEGVATSELGRCVLCTMLRLSRHVAPGAPLYICKFEMSWKRGITHGRLLPVSYPTNA